MDAFMIIGRTLLVTTLPLISLLFLGWYQREFCSIVKLRPDLYFEAQLFRYTLL
jgi:hypothetical protein